MHVTGSIDGNTGRPTELAIASTNAAVGRQVFPSRENVWMQSLPQSATYTLPSAPTTRPQAG